MTFRDNFKTNYDPKGFKEILIETVESLRDVNMKLVEDLEKSGLIHLATKMPYSNFGLSSTYEENLNMLVEKTKSRDLIPDKDGAKKEVEVMGRICEHYRGQAQQIVNSLVGDRNTQENPKIDEMIRKFGEGKREISSINQNLMNWACKSRVVKFGYYDPKPREI